MSAGKGLTSQLDKKTIGSITYCDTPGLADTEMRVAAGKAISQVLKEGGLCKVFFVVTEEAGRVRPQDAATMRLVLDAAPEIGKKFGIIVNKCTKKKIEFFFGTEESRNRTNFDKFVAHLFHGIESKNQHGNIVLLERREDLEDEEDKVIPANQINGNAYGKSIGLLKFIDWLPSINLTPGKASDVNTDDIEKIKEQFEKQMALLEKDANAMENQVKKMQEMLEKEKNKEDKSGILYHLGQLAEIYVEDVVKPVVQGAGKLVKGAAQPVIGYAEGLGSAFGAVDPRTRKPVTGARNVGHTVGQAVGRGVTQGLSRQVANTVGFNWQSLAAKGATGGWFW